MRYSIILFAVLLSIGCSKSTLNFTSSQKSGDTAPAKFEFKVTENNFDSYKWMLGDGSTSSDTTVQHSYYLSGKYEVVLQGFKGKKIKEHKKEIYVAAPEKCLVRIETPYGEMIAELFDDTPKHRDNFSKLTEEGFYDDLLFHRVINQFMIQGGDPQSKNADLSLPLGSGGPGYQIDAEFSPGRAHVKGALAAARLGDGANPQRKSSGSQFYIVHGRSINEAAIGQYEARLGLTYPDDVKQRYLNEGGVPFLDQQYTVFGQVIQGLEVIDKIAATRTNGQDRPVENISMKISLIK